MFRLIKLYTGSFNSLDRKNSNVGQGLPRLIECSVKTIRPETLTHKRNTIT